MEREMKHCAICGTAERLVRFRRSGLHYCRDCAGLPDEGVATEAPRATRKTRKIDHTGKGGPVRVSVELDWEEAAERCADVVARREYGRSAYCRHVTLNSWAEDHTSATYEAFIGVSVGDGSMAGRNIWIYV